MRSTMPPLLLLFALTIIHPLATLAQRPTNTSMCDYYTTALLQTNNATAQYTVVTMIVNTALIGNYTTPNLGVAVTGILNPGLYNGTAVNLLPFFDGAFASSNRGGSDGVAVNFLDGGGAGPLMMGRPAVEGAEKSNQFLLLTHLYQLIGALFGCSFAGTGPAFPAYSGHASMYQVHKFMDLDQDQVGYFITQVTLSAASFGVSPADVGLAGLSLSEIFGYRCSSPRTVLPAQGPQLQSICIADNCPLDPNATCSSYDPAFEPAVVNATLAMGEGGNGISGEGNGTSIVSATLTALTTATGGPVVASTTGTSSSTRTTSSTGSTGSKTPSGGVAMKVAGSLGSILLSVLASLI